MQGAALGLRPRRGQGTQVRRGDGVPGPARSARLGRPSRGLEGPEGARRRPRGGGRGRAQPAAADQALLRDRGRLGARGQGHQEPRAAVRPQHQRPGGGLRVHRRGAAALRRCDQAHRPAAGDRPHRSDRPAGRGREPVPALCDHARQPDRLAGEHRPDRPARGHRRTYRRADRGDRLDRGDPGPRREPAHRRAPDRAQADLADPGLGHARPAGPRSGPSGRARRAWR